MTPVTNREKICLRSGSKSSKLIAPKLVDISKGFSNKLHVSLDVHNLNLIWSDKIKKLKECAP
jgi:hypothetical protein